MPLDELDESTKLEWIRYSQSKYSSKMDKNSYSSESSLRRANELIRSTQQATINTPRLLIARQKMPKKTRGVLNSTIISLAIISYVISNQMATLILSGAPCALPMGNETTTTTTTKSTRCVQTKSPNERSLVGLVTAIPAPGPAPASAAARSGSATATSHRVPPMNGSIFGKRSLASNHKLHQNGALNYNDIITEVIEDFMSANNEGDPQETTVAFCRVIIYECNQLLNGRTTTRAQKLKQLAKTQTSARHNP